MQLSSQSSQQELVAGQAILAGGAAVEWPSSSTGVHERKKRACEQGGKVKKERTQRVRSTLTHCWQCLQLVKKVIVFESLQALSDTTGGN